MASPPLATNFDQAAYAKEELPPVGMRLAWWEEAPGASSRIKDKRVPPEEQWRRAQRWYRLHQSTRALTCAEAWPPMPLN